jgi:hypothetical protein
MNYPVFFTALRCLHALLLALTPLLCSLLSTHGTELGAIVAEEISPFFIC